MTTNWRAAAMAVSVILVGRPVAAQSVSDILTFLVTNQGVQTGSVERDRAAAQATSTTISRALLANLATLPVASSSGGFVYRLNPELGTPERVSQSFGPFFVERAQTAGKSQVSFGLTMQQLRFSSLDGRNLRDGSLITTANQFTDETEPFDVDRLTLDIDASMATLYVNAGVADWIDVGVALPMVSLSIDGSRVNTYRGREFTQATAQARSTGFADVIVRTKFVAYRDEGASVGGAVDVRLPTGRSDDLLGTGTTSVKLAAIGSLEHGRVSSHANAGVTVGGLAREVSYAGALAVAATGHVTVIGELIGRLIEGAGGVTAVSARHPTLVGVETIRLVPTGSTLNSIAVAPGVKWNITDTWVLAANITVPLTNDGLTTRFTPFVGLDYAIGR